MSSFIKMFTVTAMCAVGIWAQTIDWSATNITITSEAQLRELARITNGKQRNFKGQTVTLGNDVHIKDGNKNKWTPIGDFAGTFNGNGRVISGIYISNIGKSQGLFSYLENGSSIKNLGVIVHIEGYNEVAGLAVLNFGTIENSYVSGNISGRDFVGGLVAANSGVIKNCFVQGTVKGYNFTGGLVGTNSGKIENSYAMLSGDFMQMVGFQNSDPNAIRAERDKTAAEQTSQNKATTEQTAQNKTIATNEQTSQNKSSTGQTTAQQQIGAGDKDYEKRQKQIVKFTNDLEKTEKTLSEIKQTAPATFEVVSLSIELLKTLNRAQEQKSFDLDALLPLIIKATLMTLPPNTISPSVKIDANISAKFFPFLTIDLNLSQDKAVSVINSALGEWNGKSVYDIKNEMNTAPAAQKVKIGLLFKYSTGVFDEAIPQLIFTIKAN
ncbi:MAG: hypothetical protein FWF51_04515 [Chitinivibrionia bacterium]|nr:hypothetical protein [Chitinivibrionia bacterium]